MGKERKNQECIIICFFKACSRRRKERHGEAFPRNFYFLILPSFQKAAKKKNQLNQKKKK
jgi:hypothetical protein